MSEAIENLLFRVASEVATAAKDIAPKDTGNLQTDIKVKHIDYGDLSAEIGNSKITPYAEFVHNGTGLYGEHHTRIVPKNGKALKTPFGYRKSVAGQKAQPYLSDGFETYVNSGGFDRALSSCATSLKKEVLKNIEISLKNVSVG